MSLQRFSARFAPIFPSSRTRVRPSRIAFTSAGFTETMVFVPMMFATYFRQSLMCCVVRFPSLPWSST